MKKRKLRLNAYHVESNFSMTDIYCWAENKRMALEMGFHAKFPAEGGIRSDLIGERLFDPSYESVHATPMVVAHGLLHLLHKYRHLGRGYMVVRLADFHAIADEKLPVTYIPYITREEKIDNLLLL